MSSKLLLKAVDRSGLSFSIDIDISSRLGEGATAFIYKVRVQGELFAAKIYKPSRVFLVQKLEAMLAAPPASVVATEGNHRFVQYAWVSYLLKDSDDKVLGFLMPYIDHEATYSLDTYYDPILSKRLNGNHLGALSLRLEIALNLCRLICQLHDCGHHFIDIKPQNIRVYKDNHRVVLLDCDGFSISNRHGQPSRFPADLISTDFIAPEASRNHLGPSALGEGQDRYGLAVILFQLLNYGTHPFQGIVIDPNIQVSTNDERAALWLYPHGVVPHPRVKPRPQSIHELFLPESRTLFDRAFTSASRPTPHEWANHFQEILDNRLLVRCQRFPDNIGHIHFRGQACIGCAVEGQRQAKTGSSAQNSTSQNGSLRPPVGGSPAGTAQSMPGQGPGVSQGVKKSSLNIDQIVYAFIVLTVVLVTIMSISSSGSSSRSEKPQSNRGEVCHGRQLLSDVSQAIDIFPSRSSQLLNGSDGFCIDVPSGVTKLDVIVTSRTPAVDLDLYVRHEVDVVMSDAGIVADFASTSAHSNEAVAITVNTTPPIRPGRYFIAIRRFDMAQPTVRAQITATITAGAGVVGERRQETQPSENETPTAAPSNSTGSGEAPKTQATKYVYVQGFGLVEVPAELQGDALVDYANQQADRQIASRSTQEPKAQATKIIYLKGFGYMDVPADLSGTELAEYATSKAKEFYASQKAKGITKAQ